MAPEYFLGTEVTQYKDGLVIFHREYALDILEEIGTNAKSVDTLMDPNLKLVLGQGEPYFDSGRYQRIVSKLNYVTVTHSNIAFVMSIVN